jgi:hypothetical protein
MLATVQNPTLRVRVGGGIAHLRTRIELRPSCYQLDVSEAGLGLTRRQYQNANINCLQRAVLEFLELAAHVDHPGGKVDVRPDQSGQFTKAQPAPRGVVGPGNQLLRHLTNDFI